MTRTCLILIGVVGCGLAVSAMLLSGVFSSIDANGTETLSHLVSSESPGGLPIDVKRVFNEREKGLDAASSANFYLDEAFVDDESGCDFCIGVAYTPGQYGGATLGFKRTQPLDLSQAKALTFDVKGDTGNETLVIYALGSETINSNGNATPSYTNGLRGVNFAYSKTIRLDSRWQSYEIDLENFDRTGITHAFAFTISKGAGSDKQFAYFDSIQFDAKKTDYAIRLN